MEKVKDVVRAEVTGRVSRVIRSDKAVGAVIQILRQGKSNQWFDELTCWGIELEQGSDVRLVGELSWRNAKRERKDGTPYFSIEVALNNCEQVA